MKVDARYCCNDNETPFRMSFSKDGGSDWSDTITPDFIINRPNTLLSNVKDAFIFSLNISQYLDANLANNTNFRIKFMWDGRNAQDGSDVRNNRYTWLIDDIEIFDLPQHETIHQQLWLEDVYLPFRLECTAIPKSQAGELLVLSKLLYTGTELPSEFDHRITIYDKENRQMYDTSRTISTPEQQRDTLTVMLVRSGYDLSQLDVGTYRVQVVVSTSSESFRKNDTLSRTFTITRHTLGHIPHNSPSKIE